MKLEPLYARTPAMLQQQFIESLGSLKGNRPIRQLPEPLQTLATLRFIKSLGIPPGQVDTIMNFSWSRTPENHHFWHRIYTDRHTGLTLPPSALDDLMTYFEKHPDQWPTT